MVNTYLVTFNCGRELVQPELFAPTLLSALPPNSKNPDVLVLSLQEVAPLSNSFWGGSYFTSYTDGFEDAVRLATKASEHNTDGTEGLELLVTRNVGMTGIMVFVRNEIKEAVNFVEEAGVGVGWYEMGNKGAVGIRLGLDTAKLMDSVKGDEGTMEMTFVAAHLAPGEIALERRNEDSENIAKALLFTRIPSLSTSSPKSTDESKPLLEGISTEASETSHTAGLYSPNSYTFILGDLNYRTSDTSPTTQDLPRFPQPTPNRSDPLHYSHLFPKDQLSRELRAGRTCPGFVEDDVDFPPTYKYSTLPASLDKDGEMASWNWAPHRWPSWCDRILYIPTPIVGKKVSAIKAHTYRALPLMPTSDHRPVALSLDILGQSFDADTLEKSDVRLHPPVATDPSLIKWRNLARAKEMSVGLGLFLSWTYQGNALLLCTALGGWLAPSLIRYLGEA
jgi:hypothetical protein